MLSDLAHVRVGRYLGFLEKRQTGLNWVGGLKTVSEAALQSLARLKGAGRAVAVLGDMGELGHEAGPAHRAAGVLAAELGLDFLFALGDHAAEVADGVPLRCHFHNTRNTGLANAQAAVEAGVTYLDASIGGIGGCPFAPAATGNIPTDDLLYLLDRSGVHTGVSLEKIIETSRWLEAELGRGVPALLPKAGNFPRGDEQAA